jgi:8-oxo-dGTP pyrophosphatase MutT (NUDIX family)
MKVDFALPTDDALHRFCIDCRTEGVERVQRNGKTEYYCPACGHTNARAIYFHQHTFWAAKDGELWHESAGVFVRNATGKYLFFQRTEFPFSLTIPAGHVDKNETGEIAAERELQEETGVHAKTLKLLGTFDVLGDLCSAGADVHKWHMYLAELGAGQIVAIGEEGEKPVWLTLEEAQKRDLAFAIEYIVRKFSYLK